METRIITSRTNWIENNAVPDSINTNIIARSVSPPVVPKIRSFEAALTSRNTSNSLNTINPITSAFTVMEMARIAPAKMPLQTGTIERTSRDKTCRHTGS